MIIYDAEIRNFEYKRHNAVSAAYVRWWLYEQDEEGDTEPRAFAKEEAELFMNYMLNCKSNFPEGGKQYHSGEQFEAPEFEIYDVLPVETNDPPAYVVLRQHPKLETQLYKVMDIKLNPIHNYNLPFNVIGKVLSYGH